MTHGLAKVRIKTQVATLGSNNEVEREGNWGKYASHLNSEKHNA